MEFVLDVGDNPEKLLQQASDVARVMLDDQHNRKFELEAELEKVNITIMKLNQLVALGSANEVAASRPVARRRLTPRHSRARTEIVDLTSLEEQASAEATALSDIEHVLNEVESSVSVSELRELIEVTLGRSWAESTLYNHLGKGKAQGRYMNENNRWALVKDETE